MTRHEQELIADVLYLTDNNPLVPSVKIEKVCAALAAAHEREAEIRAILARGPKEACND